jgi:hypothetical protein
VAGGSRVLAWNITPLCCEEFHGQKRQAEQPQVYIRQSQPKSQPTVNHIRTERLREQTIISVIVVNYLHDARILDPAAAAQQLDPVTVETLIDGDIPVRIEVQKEGSGPAWIQWHLWPDEPGRQTWGTISVRRLSVTKAILAVGSYDRSCKRSPRLAAIPLPDGKWGLSSTECERCGIETTY